MSSMHSRISSKLLRAKVCCIQGKHVYPITKQFHTAVISLDKVGALPDETFGHILCDFIKYSNEDFNRVFQHLPTQERSDYSSSSSPIVTSSYGSSSSEPTIFNIKHILQDSNDFYNNFATSNKWVEQCCVIICFNCGGDYSLNHGKERHDQTCIVQNMAKFQEERNH